MTAKEWLIQYKPKPPVKPTIADLEAILAKDDRADLHVNPDGSVSVEPPDWQVEMCEGYAAHVAGPLEAHLEMASHALRSYEFGNSATDLAKGAADAIDAALMAYRASVGRVRG